MQTVHGTLSKIFLEPDALEFITFELAKSIVCAPVVLLKRVVLVNLL
jgi:hypothetical protein